MKKRLIFIFTFVFVAFALLSTRVYYLGNVKNRALETLKNQQQLNVEISTHRGNIYDCNFKSITETEFGNTAVIDPMLIKSDDALVLKNLGDLNSETFDKKMKSGKIFSTFIGEYNEKIDGVTYVKSYRRYSHDNMLQHLIGYMDNTGFKGMMGLEKQFDKFLNSQSEQTTLNYIVDANRKAISGIAPKITKQNKNEKDKNGGIVLTIDKDIQKIAEECANKYIEKGAVVISDINTGEIKAMVSRPTFDPYNISQYSNSKNGELINRTLSKYPLGSIFKICVSIAGIETGIADNLTIDCTGSIKSGDKVFKCAKDEGHGVVNLQSAFANSCNPYFIDLTSKIGADKVYEVAERFNFGESIQLYKNIKTERSTMPILKKPIPPAVSANFSIGQGKITISPVGVNAMVAAIANGGKYCTPSIIKGETYDGKYIVNRYSSPIPVQVIDPIVAFRVQNLMVGTVQNGTGVAAMPKQFGAGGKTSSAQTGSYDKEKQTITAWFSGFFPAFDPKYAITIVSENAKSGSRSCAPVFKDICNGIIDKNLIYKDRVLKLMH